MSSTIYDKNIIEMLVLFLLCKEDLYAYNIMKLIQSMSHDILSVQGGSLYPILYKLTEKGYITDRVEVIGKRQRMTRVYYHITESGKNHLQELIDNNNRIQLGIRNVFENASVEEIQ